MLIGIQNLLIKMSKKTPQIKKSLKSRAKYDCPEELDELIYVANLLPKEFHFDLMETVRENLKKIEHLKPQIDFDETTDVDEVLKRSRLYMASIKHWDNLFERCYDHNATWLEFYLSLPVKVKEFLISSEEVKEFEKAKSHSYWTNNDGIAWDFLLDLNRGNKITDEEFEQIQETGEFADFLVEKGYYGEEWSKSQEEENDNYEDGMRLSDKFYLSEYFAKYRAFIRLEKIRDFIHGLADLAEQLGNNKNSFRVDLFDHLPKKIVEEVRATDIKINEQGEIHFSVSKWAEVIQGVDISRIRRCEVCQKIFWAKRKDAFACSLKHAKTRQMRLLRANWKDKGDLYLKARKKKPKTSSGEKKNGSL